MWKFVLGFILGTENGSMSYKPFEGMVLQSNSSFELIAMTIILVFLLIIFVLVFSNKDNSESNWEE